MKTNPAKSVAFDSQDALHKLGERKAIQHHLFEMTLPVQGGTIEL